MCHDRTHSIAHQIIQIFFSLSFLSPFIIRSIHHSRLIWKQLILFIYRFFFASKPLLFATFSLIHPFSSQLLFSLSLSFIFLPFASLLPNSSSLISYLTNEWIEIWFDVRIIYFIVCVHSNSTRLYYIIWFFFVCSIEVIAAAAVAVAVIVIVSCCSHCKCNISRVFILNSRHRSKCSAMGFLLLLLLLLLLLMWWITNNKNIYFLYFESHNS